MVSGAKKRRETSKAVLAWVLAVCGVLAVAVVVGWFLGRADAAGMLAAVFVPAGAAIGFYCWKAKAENVLKLTKPLGKEAQAEAMQALAKERADGRAGYYDGY